jgi:hypothetical protein
MNPLLAFERPLSEAATERLGWVLVHSFWQFAAVALVAGFTVRALRRRSAEVRYAVLVAAMGVAVAAPIATWMLLPGTRYDESRPLASSEFDPGLEISAHRPADAGPLADYEVLAGGPVVDDRSADLAQAQTSTEIPPAVSAPPQADTSMALSWSERAAVILRPWLAWIVAGWSIGVALCSLRPLLGWRTLWRLQRMGLSPVPEEVLSAMNRVSARLGLRDAVRVAQSTLAQVPVVAGYFRP